MKTAASILLAGLVALETGLPSLSLSQPYSNAANLLVLVAVAMVTAYLAPSAAAALRRKSG